MIWEDKLRDRLNKMPLAAKDGNHIPLCIKVATRGSCYHRQHSPEAYKLIDQYLSKHSQGAKYTFEEHESGPEILIVLDLAAKGLGFAKSIIDLLVVLIKSGHEGMRRGDMVQSSLEIIVRGFDEKGTVKEEKILRFNSDVEIDKKVIEEALGKGVKAFLSPQKKISSKKSKNVVELILFSASAGLVVADAAFPDV